MTFDELFNITVKYENCELVEYEKGRVVVRTVVNESDTNPYGKAHGGFLYTLCDSLSGLLGYSLGYYIVTLQANINYIKEAELGDILTVTGVSVHSGKTTDVADMSIVNQDNKLIAKASFTMFNIKEVEEENKL